MTNVTWMDNAACKGNQEPFFDEVHMKIVKEARKVCAGCPVKMQCLGRHDNERTREDRTVLEKRICKITTNNRFFVVL